MCAQKLLNPDMNSEYLEGLRECCQSDAAFERMQQILLKAEAERQQTELKTLSLLRDRVRHAIVADDHLESLQSLKQLIVARTNALQRINERLQREIADRQWAETALQKSEQRFRSLIENATDIIVILDKSGVFRYCSPSAKRVLGYTLADVVDHSAAEFVHPDDVGLILQVLEHAIGEPGRSQAAIEYRVRHQNGSWCLFEAVATSLLDDPAIAGVVINCHDITERKQAEEALREANRRVANILESITDTFISVDRGWRLTYLNHHAEQRFQSTQAKLLGRDIWEAFPALNGSLLDLEAHRALEQQTVITFEEFYPFLNTWFEVRIFPAADGLSIFFLDVTERQQAQAELLEMSTALGNAVEGIARLDRQGRYIALNRAYAAALGYDQAEMIGMNWQKTVHPDDIPFMETTYQQMVSEGKAVAEVRGLCKDGSFLYKEAVMVAAYDWHDRLIGHHCFTKDITERKQAEEAKRQQAERERLMVAIAQRIRNSLNLADILNTTVAEVRQFLQADRVLIVQMHSTGSASVVAESVDANEEPLLGWTVNGRATVEMQINPVEQTVIVNTDTRHCFQPTLFQQEYLRRSHSQAEISVPLSMDQQLFGLLIVDQCTGPREWQRFEVDLLTQLATQVEIAVQQAHLYHQVQQFNTELEGQVQERTAQLQQALHYEAMLQRIADAVRDSLDEQKILQTAVQELAVGLGASSCRTGLYDLKHERSTIGYEFIRAAAPSLQGQIIGFDKHPEIYGQLLNGQPLQFCRRYTTSDAPMLGPFINAHFSVLACPLIGEHGVIGDLWVYKPGDACYANLEIRLVQQVANQCAIAIRQARLYQASQAQVAALEELNQLKDDFLSTVSHELRTPMSNMKMAIHMLRSVTTPDRQERYLNILQAECVREIELINDLLDLQRLEASSYPVSPQTLDLQQCLNELVEPFFSRTAERQQHLIFQVAPDLPDLQTDRSALERILAELLNNACKYTSPGGKLLFCIEPEWLDGGPAQIVFRVGNQAEIAATELPRIFEKFYRVQANDRWKQGGTGLGLALVQRLVQQLGGSIQAGSEHEWTIFTVTLPITSSAVTAVVPLQP